MIVFLFLLFDLVSDPFSKLASGSEQPLCRNTSSILSMDVLAIRLFASCFCSLTSIDILDGSALKWRPLTFLTLADIFWLGC